MIGRTILHYKIVDKVGEGGMGIVYKAEDLKLNRLVALKFLPPFASDADKQRFVQEARAISTLNHPHIATIHDIEEADGRLFIVFEYLSGGSLKSTIQKLQSEGKALPLQQALDYALQIVEGLRHAHSHGIIHRDVKLDNILLSAEGEVKITDFGLAKLAGEVGLTRTDSVVGTTAYMSPEQLLGGEVDHRTDIFSFGIVLFEMITGGRPFRGDHEAALMYSIVNEDPRPMKDLRKDFPPELESIVNRALAKSPEDRYSNVDELMEEIRHLKGISAGGRRVRFKPRLFGKALHFSLPVAITSSIVFILVAVVVVFSLLHRGDKLSKAFPAPRKSVAVLPFENYTGEKSFDRYRIGLATMLIADLSQLKSVRVLSERRLYEILKDLKVLEQRQYDSETFEKIRKYADVDHIIMGGLNKAGARIRLDFQVQDASTAEIIGGDRVEGNTEEAILSMVDTMSSKVQKVLGVSEVTEAATAKGIAEITSGSLEANLLYEEGVSNFYKGNYLKAIEFLQEAVDRDSTFALALSQLAETYSVLGYDLRAAEYADRALQYDDRVTINQRYTIEANHAKSHYNYDDAVEIYQKLAAISPQDPHIHFGLAMAFERLELIDSAIVNFQRVVGMEKNNAAAYVRLGILHAKKGSPKLASEAIDKALKIYSVLGSQEGRASALIALGYVFIRRGEYDEARKAYEEALQVQRDLRDTSGVGSALLTIGTAYHHQGDLPQALKHYSEALPIVNEIGNKLLRGNLLNNIGTVYLQRGEYKRALEYHNSALKIAKEIHNKKLLAEGEYMLGLDHQRMGDGEEALPYIEKAHEYFREIGDKSHIGTSALAIGDERGKEGRIDEALQLFLESLAMGRQIQDRGLIALSSGRVGSIHALQARYEQAMQFCQEALRVSEASQAKSGMAYAFRDIGFNFFSVGDIDTAVSLYLRALSLAQEVNLKPLVAQIFSDLAECWQFSGREDSSLAFYTRAINLLKETKSVPEEIETKSRLAILYVGMNRIKEGVSLAREALNQATRAKDAELTAVASSRLARCYLVAKQYRQAEEGAQKTVSVCLSLGMREILWRSYVVLAKAFHAQKKNSEALGSLRRAIETLGEIERDLAKKFQFTFRRRKDIQGAVLEVAAMLEDMKQVDEAKRIREKYKG